MVRTAVFLALLACLAHADTITNQLGDADFFGSGLALPLGSTYTPPPPYTFDNRDPSDPPFTDFGFVDDEVVWSHDLSSTLAGYDVVSVTVELAMWSVQDGQAGFQSLIDDLLFFEGIEVAGAFDTTSQGPFGTGLIVFSLSGAQLALFDTDRVLDIRLASIVPAVSGGIGDAISVDFSRVTVTAERSSSPPIPEPGAFALVGVALLGWGFARRRRTSG